MFLTEIGDVVAFGADGAAREEPIPSGSMLVDGLTIGEVTNVVLRDRRRLAADGVLFVSVTLDRETGELLSGPDFVSRGFLQHDSDEPTSCSRRRGSASTRRSPAARAGRPTSATWLARCATR